MYISKKQTKYITSKVILQGNSPIEIAQSNRAGQCYIKKHQDGTKKKVVSILNTIYEAKAVDEIDLDALNGKRRPSTTSQSTTSSLNSFDMTSSNSSDLNMIRHKSSPNQEYKLVFRKCHKAIKNLGIIHKSGGLQLSSKIKGRQL